MSSDPKLDSIIKSILRTVELAAKYGNEEQRNLSTYITMVEQLYESETDLNHFNKALATVNDCTTIEEFDTKLEQELSEQPSTNSNDKLNNFKQKARYIMQNTFAETTIRTDNHNTNGAEPVVTIDNEIEMTETIPDVDPLTKRPLENPVRNTLCGHVYGKISILESLQLNRRLRCPIVGCANKEFIIPSNLIEDDEIARKLHIQRSQNMTRC